MFNKLETVNNPPMGKTNPKLTNIDKISKVNMLHENATPP
jgi:hypothetical protein